MKKIINFFIVKTLFGFNYKNKILKSHIILKKKNNIENKINLLKEELEEYFTTKKNLNYSIDYERSYIQFIYKNLINKKFFNEKLIFEKCFNEIFYYPFPFEILKIIEKKGFKVNFYFSISLWYFLLFLYLIFNFIKVFQPFFLKKKKNLNYDKNIKIFLSSIPPINIIDDKESRTINFYTWFSNFFLEKYKIKKNIIFFHENKLIKNVKKNFKNNLIYEICYSKDIHYQNLITSDYILSVFESLGLIYQIGFDKILILDEIIKYNYVRRNKKLKIDYALFNISNMVFQPLWSKLKNSKDEHLDYLFFYSTNIIPLVEQPQLKPNSFGYRLHSWNNYIFWNESQKKWVEYCAKKKLNTSVINNFIPFEGKNISIIKNQIKKIIIFDIPPKNDLIYYNLMHVNNIYTNEYCSNFFLDVINSIKNVYPKAKIIYKSKERNSNAIHQEYKKLVSNHITKSKNFDVYYSEVSAHSLIMACDAAISIPFTSTALIANYLKKPSIYYHPSKKLLMSEYFPKNVDQINNENDLRSWLKKI